jgi:hypothetical protein
VSEDSHAEVETAGHPDTGEAHGEIHMPPNSWAPISVALSLALVFVGLLGDIRNAIGPTMWLIGLLALIASCASWARSARREYLELPEESHH